MVYMLFDNPADKKNMDFLDKDKTSFIQQVYPSKKCNSIKEMLLFCKEVLSVTKERDVIVCWYDFMAIICWWLCKFTGKKRNIIAINILLKDKKTVKNKFAKFLYKISMNSDRFKATVTSQKYGEHINKLLGVNKHFVLLHDIYHGNYGINYKGEIIENSVFCGGRNGRDWEFLIQIANEMPEVTFNCVMPKTEFEKYQKYFTKNMMVKTEIPEIEFLEIMCQSELVVMPLDTEAPAGLIAFYQAAANGKMAITTNTVTTQEYFSNNRGGLCGNKIQDWKETISYYLVNKNKADLCAKKFREFLENECSQSKYAKTLCELIINTEEQE